mmetsp:Transcript_6605/g.9662  ORF Transcript_6605/g.9662 Transcript_6605/m.9662 type:complete len:83 (+) Transcript_6605:124-372(+)|eukprot:CAMPEP_0194048248 /NCGR_PEP_ID=MMETSP0009_2-20130614/26809_1 /TAXON_ID=210454 /ORGANISM="Grammatophora oceanica, Strain CCMP 410" /LENGTH=82 /DNA_ID=CAMNT_0038694069 /DNA_START=110 /DNA_END=358 /DNA_ORIENTATION=+
MNGGEEPGLPKTWGGRVVYRLRRLPMHWKLLFGAQLCFTGLSLTFRLSDVRRSRKYSQMKGMEANKLDPEGTTEAASEDKQK